jgi:MOSC domain-containing protein YiiM
MNGTVIAVSCDTLHRFSKRNQSVIRLIAGFGVEGDAHAGSSVRHLYLAKRDPTLINLRQIHLIHAELHDELKEIGFVIEPGELGENVTTRGVDLLGLPLGTLLYLGAEAVVEMTGLRTPCSHIDRFRKGLKRTMIVKCPRYAHNL